MELQAYPRPTNDTGIGVHWCTGISHIDVYQLRSFWIPELLELGVSWVKIADHRRAFSLAEELLVARIMPVVQLYRPGLVTDRLDAAQLAEIEDLISIGVRYFEFTNRPDAPQRWPYQQLPPDALAQVTDYAAIDMFAILERGGLPAIPAVAPHLEWDLVKALIERGHADLLDGPVWQAIHNFAGNRPLNYPHDPANREGAPLTQEYYAALLQEDWGGEAWQGRDLESINQLRRRYSQALGLARVDLPPEVACWLLYEQVNARNLTHLGRSLPILATAGGWIVNTGEDPRYPVVTPLLHMAQTIEACRTMMGTSRRHPPAPDYFFCSAHWLLANEALASDLPTYETACWYSDLWPQQTLPIVPALKAEPKRSRVLQPPLHDDSPAERPATNVFIPYAPAANMPRKSRIIGHVRGGAEADLWLVRSDGVLYRTLAHPDGSFKFAGLARGRYTLWVNEPPGSRRENIELDGNNQLEVKLTVDRWGYELVQLDGVSGMFLRCRVESSAVTAESGTLAVRLRRSDDPAGQGGRVVNMARRSDGVVACELTPLASGKYRVEVLGVTTANGDPCPLDAVVEIKGPAQISFIYNRPLDRGFLRYSRVYGHVANGAGYEIALIDAQGNCWIEIVDDDERYGFDHLPAGIYTLTVVGHEAIATRNRLALDGKNQIQCDFVLYTQPSQVEETTPWGRVELILAENGDHGEAGNFHLIGENGEIFSPSAAAGDWMGFDQIPPGVYTFSGDNYWHPGIEVYADYLLSLQLPAQAPRWEWNVDEIAATDSGIRVQVMGRQGVTVSVSDRYNVEWVAKTDTVAGEPFVALFDSLAPGVYVITLYELNLRVQVQLPEATIAHVRFLRSGALDGVLQMTYTPL